MNIVHAIMNLRAGGAQTFTVNLAVQQKRDGNDVSVIVIDRLENSGFENSLKDKLLTNGIQIFCLNRRLGKNLSIFKCYISLCKILSKVRPEIINSHLSLAHLILGIVLKTYPFKNPPKHIITLHSAPEKWSALNLFVNSKTPSIYCSQSSIDTCKVRDCPKTVIINGISQPVINGSGKQIIESCNIQENNKLVFLVGQVSTAKNYELACKVASSYIDKNVTFLICGLPGNSFEKDIKLFQNTSNIVYLGIKTQNEIYSLIHNCDCFLNTSIREGLPISVLEAFFIGIPCVLSPIPPHYEISNGVPHTYIADSFAPLSFINLIDKVIGETIDKEVIKIERENALLKFNISITSSMYLKFYQSQLNNLPS